MALEVVDVKKAVDDALHFKIIDAVVSSDQNEIDKLATIRKIVYRIEDSAIDAAMIQLFVEAQQEVTMDDLVEWARDRRG